MDATEKDSSDVFLRGIVPPLATPLTSDCEPAKARDGDGFAFLKGGLEEV